jgi:aquaporin Z
MKYVYEFIGTFFLVFVVGMTVMVPQSAGIMAPVAIGLVLATMIYAGAHVSGGHYNPAVSFAIYLRGKLSTKDLGKYWAVQLIAAIVAAIITLYYKRDAAQPSLPFDWCRMFVAEFLFTFALCFVVLNVALAKGTKGNPFYGLAIGFTVLVGAYAVGPISGAAFNPAVALGATIMTLISWSNLWIYFVANLLGGFCAAYVFKQVEGKAE